MVWIRAGKVPGPGVLFEYAHRPPSAVLNSVPTEIPAFDDGVVISCIATYLLSASGFDSIFSSAKPWSSKSCNGSDTNGTTKKGKTHNDYFVLKDGQPKRQSNSAGAVAIKTRCRHHTDSLFKCVFKVTGAPYAVIILQLERGWKDKLAAVDAVPYLDRRITDEIRACTPSSSIMDADQIRSEVERKTGHLLKRSQKAKLAIFGTRTNETPDSLRVVTMSAVDIPAPQRLDYIQNLNIAPEAKEWASKNGGELASCSLEARLDALNGLGISHTNGIEALNKQIPIWCNGARNVPEVVDNIEERMKMLDKDIARAVLKNDGEILCSRFDEARPDKVMKDVGVDNVCLDEYDQLHDFAKLEALFGSILVSQCRKIANKMQIKFFSSKQFAVFCPNSCIIEAVNLNEPKRLCTCRSTSILCPHLLVAWRATDTQTSIRSIEDFLLVNEGPAEMLVRDRYGHGNKSGVRSRRRGTASTRVRNNTKVSHYVANPTQRRDDTDEDGDAETLYGDSPDEDGDLTDEDGDLPDEHGELPREDGSANSPNGVDGPLTHECTVEGVDSATHLIAEAIF